MNYPTTLLTILLLTLYSVGLADPIETDQTLAPYFQIISGSDVETSEVEVFPLLATEVDVKISGIIANVEVRQTYQNRGKSPLEAIYVFPGSTRAAVHGLALKIEDRTIEADVQERQQANATYEQAKNEGKTASLLEQHRPNVFQMNVANILSGETVEAVLQYTERLKPTDKIYDFAFPTVVGPRYSGGATLSSRPQDQWVANPYLEPDGDVEAVDLDPHRFHIDVHLDAGMPIQELICDTHLAETNYLSPSQVEVKMSDPGVGAGNRDFILRYRLADETIASGLLLHEGDEDEENFFLLTVQPPERVHPEQIPPRDYVFVVDVSGSMNGFPLKTARSLMKDLVGNLHESDTFNILLFAGGSEVLSPDPIPATRQNLSDALRWLDRAKGGGGTELLSALHRALNLQTAEGTSRSIVVVTDGYVSFEREAFETVTDNLGHANLFAFGIGSSVNRYLIEGMARVGRGEPFIVTEPKHASEQAELFRDYISAPVLTDIDIDFEGFEVYDVEPATYPDILADRPLTVFGKWRGRPRGRIDVSGATGTGPFDSSTMVDSSELNNSSLPYLWARDRIASLSDFEGPRSTDQELRQQITTLGLTYNLLTEHTSFVAVDSIVRTDPGGAIDSVKQPLPLPAGVPASAVGGGTTPAPGLIPLIIAALSALFGRRFLSRRKGEEGS